MSEDSGSLGEELDPVTTRKGGCHEETLGTHNKDELSHEPGLA
jgi:hypothetical protein